MKPIFQKLTAEPAEGFAFKNLRAPGFDCPWHVHPEYELILVLQSRGYRIVGDNISALGAGDLVFIGPWLPHIWQNEPSSDGNGGGVHVLLVQFEERFLGDGWLRLPALERIRRLFRRATRGLHITGETRERVTREMLALDEVSGLDRMIQVLRILDVLGRSEECHPLASASFAFETETYDQERMNRVFQFLNAQLGQVVRLSDCAKIVGLSEGAFSRFFHAHTGKTFPEFLNELRIGRACRLLIEQDRNVTEVSYECGFSSLSNFNRQFLRLKGISPREFRREMQARLMEPALRDGAEHSRTCSNL